MHGSPGQFFAHDLKWLPPSGADRMSMLRSPNRPRDQGGDRWSPDAVADCDATSELERCRARLAHDGSGRSGWITSAEKVVDHAARMPARRFPAFVPNDDDRPLVKLLARLIAGGAFGVMALVLDPTEHPER